MYVQTVIAAVFIYCCIYIFIICIYKTYCRRHMATLKALQSMQNVVISTCYVTCSGCSLAVCHLQYVLQAVVEL